MIFLSNRESILNSQRHSNFSGIGLTVVIGFVVGMRAVARKNSELNELDFAYLIDPQGIFTTIQKEWLKRLVINAMPEAVGKQVALDGVAKSVFDGTGIKQRITAFVKQHRSN